MDEKHMLKPNITSKKKINKSKISNFSKKRIKSTSKKSVSELPTILDNPLKNTKKSQLSCGNVFLCKNNEISNNGNIENGDLLQNKPPVKRIFDLAYFKGRLNGYETKILADSGASVSIIGDNFIDKSRIEKIDECINIVSANGSPLYFIGIIKVNITIGDRNFAHECFVIPSISLYCILGADFLYKYKVLINFEFKRIEICGLKIPLETTDGTGSTKDIQTRESKHQDFCEWVTRLRPRENIKNAELFSRYINDVDCENVEGEDHPSSNNP